MQNSVQDWQIQYNLKQHKQRLKEIKHERQISAVSESKRTIQGNKRKSFPDRDIAKENEVIIKKLQQQTHRKPEFSQVASDWPKTLNAPQRNQEARRIALENERFARRICEKPSVINIRNLETDFKRNRKYVRIRSKSHVSKATPKLPALKPKPVPAEVEEVPGEPLEYSTYFKLMSITPLPELGMDAPLEIAETSEEYFVETE